MMNASDLIDQQIAQTPDWRGKVMTKLRKLIHEADPEIVEEWKWGTGIYTHGKMICAVSAFKDHVKINFFKGALLEDKHQLFNNGFDAKEHRSIDFREGGIIDELKLKDLIAEAVAKSTGNSV